MKIQSFSRQQGKSKVGIYYIVKNEIFFDPGNVKNFMTFFNSYKIMKGFKIEKIFMKKKFIKKMFTKKMFAKNQGTKFIPKIIFYKNSYFFIFFFFLKSFNKFLNQV